MDDREFVIRALAGDHAAYGTLIDAYQGMVFAVALNITGDYIDSEEFAEKVLEIMETDLDPANSYLVTLDEKGKLQWTAEGPDGPEVWNKEPGTTAWQRFKVRVMSWIPMEKEL